MSLILFDDASRHELLPLTYTRPCADLRLGILTIAEKWELISKHEVSFLSVDYLNKKFPSIYSQHNYLINGRIIPTQKLWSEIEALDAGQALFAEDSLIAAYDTDEFDEEAVRDHFERIDVQVAPQFIKNVHDLFTYADSAIRADFDLLTEGRNSAAISNTNTLIGDAIFIEEGAKVEASIINASSGPVYIGKNAEVMEGCMIRGPFALGTGSTVKMGAKIYGGTTIGPACKVGGEINNVVFQANSNKAHDGFLGNSVIGEWCNLGADTNCSNLKNNYAPVKLWSFHHKRFINTGLQFCGLIMADHSKCGINTMFNTGTVIGVSANIFGAGFPRNFVPSFTWGGSTGFTTYTLNKVFETADKVLARRNQEFGDIDKDILKHIFESSSEHRFWEKQPRTI
ncbi:glucose-1-phosphate thymidylyltransferase [bacterium]|nr:glucose-1-phosphate thymidylyltransferase [bacterium]